MKKYISPRLEIEIISSEEIMFVATSGNVENVSEDMLPGMSASDFFGA